MPGLRHMVAPHAPACRSTQCPHHFDLTITPTYGESAFSQSALTILHRMFNDHVRMVERHPALAKVVFSDHLRVQSRVWERSSPKSTTPMSGVSLLCLRNLVRRPPILNGTHVVRRALRVLRLPANNLCERATKSDWGAGQSGGWLFSKALRRCEAASAHQGAR
jgi:hypothetical protein